MIQRASRRSGLLAGLAVVSALGNFAEATGGVARGADDFPPPGAGAYEFALGQIADEFES